MLPQAAFGMLRHKPGCARTKPRPPVFSSGRLPAGMTGPGGMEQKAARDGHDKQMF